MIIKLHIDGKTEEFRFLYQAEAAGIKNPSRNKHITIDRPPTKQEYYRFIHNKFIQIA